MDSALAMVRSIWPLARLAVPSRFSTNEDALARNAAGRLAGLELLDFRLPAVEARKLAQRGHCPERSAYRALSLRPWTTGTASALSTGTSGRAYSPTGRKMPSAISWRKWRARRLGMGPPRMRRPSSVFASIPWPVRFALVVRLVCSSAMAAFACMEARLPPGSTGRSLAGPGEEVTGPSSSPKAAAAGTLSVPPSASPSSSTRRTSTPRRAAATSAATSSGTR